MSLGGPNTIPGLITYPGNKPKEKKRRMYKPRNTLVKQLQGVRDTLMSADKNTPRWRVQFYAVNTALSLAIEADFAYRTDVKNLGEAIDEFTREKLDAELPKIADKDLS